MDTVSLLRSNEGARGKQKEEEGKRISYKYYLLFHSNINSGRLLCNDRRLPSISKITFYYVSFIDVTNKIIAFYFLRLTFE